MIGDGDAVSDVLKEINPSKMVVQDGFIYGLQPMKNTRGVPLPLMRFKLAN